MCNTPYCPDPQQDFFPNVFQCHQGHFRALPTRCCHNSPFPACLFTVQLSFLKMLSYNVAKNFLLVSGRCCLSASSSVSMTENLPAKQLLSPEAAMERDGSRSSELWDRDLQLLQGAFQVSRIIFKLAKLNPFCLAIMKLVLCAQFFKSFSSLGDKAVNCLAHPINALGSICFV